MQICNNLITHFLHKIVSLKSPKFAVNYHKIKTYSNIKIY